VLYRGVFVERVEVPQLWGLEGAIHVDPKHFRPKLNREGFVGEKLSGEVAPYLKSAHPLVLKGALSCIQELLRARDDWSLSKAVTLWLAVPRGGEYKPIADSWDEEFKSRLAFKLLNPANETEVSIADIIRLNAEKIQLAPDQIGAGDLVVGQAIRILRAKREIVVQGLQRDSSFLSHASLLAPSTSWLLLNAFKDDLPTVIEVSGCAQDVVSQESLLDVYVGPPMVKLVKLGESSAPFVALRSEIWVNIESSNGKEIVRESCDRNEGHLGLWVACMRNAPEEGHHLDQVGALLRRHKPSPEKLGLVRRQYIRNKLT